MLLAALMMGCTTTAESGCDLIEGYADLDGDGYGGEPVTACPGEDVAELVGDCDDADSGRSPGAPEECSSAADSDCDGLVGCEDGDCLSACLEADCTDSVDNDGDGLTDCSDEDCLWEAVCEHHPGGVLVSLTGGHMEQKLSYVRSEFSYASARGTGLYTSVLTDLIGTVQVLPPHAYSFGTTTARTTCAWGIDTVSVQGRIQEGHLDSSSPGVPYRTGFWIDSGCRLSATDFLPGLIIARKAEGWIAAPFVGSTFFYRVKVWYGGSILRSFTATSSFTESTHSGSVMRIVEREYTWLSADLLGGNTYHAYP